MSSGPYCSAFKFPAVLGSVHESPDYTTEAAMAMSSPLSEDHDYFSILGPPLLLATASTFVSPQKLGQLRGANSISSVGSDATYVDPLSAKTAHFLSTDTLVEHVDSGTSPKSSRRVPGRTAFSHRTVSLSSLNLGLLRNPDGSKSDLYVRTPHSALDLHFLFHRTHAEKAGDKVDSKDKADPRAEVTFGVLPPLRLTKQLTSPQLTSPQLSLVFAESIKVEQSKRTLYQPVQQNMSESIIALSRKMKYLLTADIAQRIAHPSALAHTTLPGVLVVDIRPFTDYARGHVTGSLNVCLPLTLLKRANFSFQKCINSLPNYEKLVLLNYLHYNDHNYSKDITFDADDLGRHGLPPIIVYDNSNASSNVYHMCKKLTDFSCWDEASAPPIYLMNSTFESFAKLYPHLISIGKEEPVDLSTLPVSTVPELLVSRLLGKQDMSQPAGISIRTHEYVKSSPQSTSLVTPSVSNFVLPTDLPNRKFSIRHNEETFDCVPEQRSLSVSTVLGNERKLLPLWLLDIFSHDDKIRADFNKLEKSEQMRLNNVLTLQKSETLKTPGGTVEVSPEISCGLDYGHKNRYKDIFLYNHSRVYLRPADGSGTSQQDCDYINASYLEPMASISSFVAGGKSFSDLDLDSMRFIATQGPLEDTIGDFWKCVVNQKCFIVVSLTNEIENGVHKCSTFWAPGVYFSGTDKIEVQIIEQQKCGRIYIRFFEILVNNYIKHTVIQVHLEKWEDMSANVEVNDLLSVVFLKRYILSHSSMKSKHPTIVHCSAGCGRTGVFCAVDSLVSLLEFNDNGYALLRDPVYDVVNNLRQQRILMVQTMRQYCLIYDVLVQYVLRGKVFLDLCSLDIVSNFLERV